MSRTGNAGAGAVCGLRLQGRGHFTRVTLGPLFICRCRQGRRWLSAHTRRVERTGDAGPKAIGAGVEFASKDDGLGATRRPRC